MEEERKEHGLPAQGVLEQTGEYVYVIRCPPAL
jgi:hypothetical protein